MDLTLTSKTPRSEEELKRIASFGTPDDYEWGKVEQYGAKVKVICRSKQARGLSPSKAISNVDGVTVEG